jgi:hypothetical protein
MDIASRASLLRETAEHHDPYEKTHAPHNWWDWYAAYMDAREHGSTPGRHRRPRAATWRKSCTYQPYEFIAAHPAQIGACQGKLVFQPARDVNTGS